MAAGFNRDCVGNRRIFILDDLHATYLRILHPVPCAMQCDMVSHEILCHAPNPVLGNRRGVGVARKEKQKKNCIQQTSGISYGQHERHPFLL